MNPTFLRLTAIFTIFLASLTGFAQDTSPSYNFLNIPSSTLVYGLGGINITAIDDDINVVDQNPGLLGPEIGMQLGFNYMRYIGDSNFAGVRFGRAAGEHGAWAIGIQYLGYGSIKSADINGVLTGEFSPKDMVINGIYSHDISDRWRGGINIKYVYSSYDAYTAMALATDLGVNYYDPDRDLSFSAVVANLGGQIKRFNESYDRLPIDLRLGWTQSFGSLPIRWSVTAWNLFKWHLPYYDAGDGSLNANPKMRDSFASN
ncbi:MAG: type IX secretion system protein PorQ, partial [Duncaniella sp.]|nr:type IX secretion system protein PorQ [Duncaniella sp.]